MTAFFVHYSGPTKWYFGEWDMGGGWIVTALCDRTVAKDRG